MEVFFLFRVGYLVKNEWDLLLMLEVIKSYMVNSVMGCLRSREVLIGLNILVEGL